MIPSGLKKKVSNTAIDADDLGMIDEEE